MTCLRLALLLTIGLSLMSVPSNSQPVEDGSLLLVANKGAQTLGIVDPKGGTQIATVPEGGVTGHEVAASPDGRLAYVPIYGNSGVGKPGTDGTHIIVIDVASRKVVGNIDFGKGIRPHCAVFGPKDGMLYVTTELDKTISIIDPKTLKIVGTIPTGQPESHMLAISPDGTRGYTANVGPGTISVLDMVGRKTVTVIPVSSMIQRISVSVDGNTVFTADQAKPQLVAIDAATNKVKATVPLAATGYGTAPTPDGKWLVVAVPGVNKVAVVDLATMKVAKEISVPAIPQETLVQPDGKYAYASCDSSHKIAMIRTSDWTVEKLIDAGAGTDGLAWAARK